MKKQLLLVIITMLACMAKSQILNSSFENLTADGKVKNWGMALFTVIYLDSNGVTHGDSIVYDRDLYFSTNDAHYGSKALEMRNAFNYTSNQGITASVKLMSNDSDYFAFAPMATFHQRPADFSFYYKFFPAAGDTAFASMTIYDSLEQQIGYSAIEISALTNTYTQATKPVIYSSASPAAFVAIQFSTAKPGSQANFGTRFLVDDVGTQTATALYPQLMDKATVKVFPNPVQDHLNIGPGGILGGQDGTVEISDMTGKMISRTSFSSGDKNISIDVRQLEKGMYSLHLTSGKYIYDNTFIK